MKLYKRYLKRLSITLSLVLSISCMWSQTHVITDAWVSDGAGYFIVRQLDCSSTASLQCIESGDALPPIGHYYTYSGGYYYPQNSSYQTGSGPETSCCSTPTYTYTDTDAQCGQNDGSISVNSSGYKYYALAGGNWTGPSYANYTFNNLSPGSYTVYITSDPSSNNCYASFNTTIGEEECICNINIINNNCDPVTLYWNNNGSLTNYGTIGTGQSVVQSTDEGHNWVVKNSNNEELMFLSAICGNTYNINCPDGTGGGSSNSSARLEIPADVSLNCNDSTNPTDLGFGVVASNEDCISSTIIKWDLDACTSYSSNGSNVDFSEFTPYHVSNNGCTSVTASNIYKDPGMGHSCAYPRAGALGEAMCSESSPNATFVNDDDRAVRFEVTIDPATTGQLHKLEFWESAPTTFDWIDGIDGQNNYPRKYGIRVLKNGTEIFKEVNIPTTTGWTLETFDFSSNPDFTITTATTFEFELTGYDRVNNGASVAAWELDDLRIEACCNNFNASDYEITFEDSSSGTCPEVITRTWTATADSESADREVTGTINCNTNESYAAYFNNFVNGITDPRYDVTNGSFIEDSNGTARYTGLVTNNTDPTVRFNIDVTFSGRTFTAPTDSPKFGCNGTQDVSDWYYYTVVSGSMTGEGSVAGALVNIGRYGPAFQLGTGASLNENGIFGGSVWLTLNVQSQPTNSTYALTDCNGGCADFNFRLSGSALTENSTPIVLSEIQSITLDCNATVDAGANQTICQGESATISASVTNANNYTWNSGQSTQSITVSPLTTTTYTVTITDDQGCTKSDDVIVTVENCCSLTVNAGADQLICDPQAVDLSATSTGEQGTVSYSWSNGMTGSNISVDVNSDMNLTVTATDSEGCTSTDQVSIVLPVFTIDAGADQSTCNPGDCFTIGANPVAPGGANYSWSTGQSGNIKMNGANADFGQIQVCPTETTTYTLTVDYSGCQQTDEVTITIGGSEIADVGADQTICEGESVILSASPSAGGSSISECTIPSQNTPIAHWTMDQCNADDSFAEFTANISNNGFAQVTNASIGSTYNRNGTNPVTKPLEETYPNLHECGIGSNGSASGDQVICFMQDIYGNTYEEVQQGYQFAELTVSPSDCGAITSFEMNVNFFSMWGAGPQTMYFRVKKDGTEIYLDQNIATPSGYNIYAFDFSGLADFEVTSTSTFRFEFLAFNDSSADSWFMSEVDDIKVFGGGGTTTTLESTYAWSSGEDTKSITVTPSATTTYTVTITDAQGCTATDDVIVTVENCCSLTVNAGADQLICDPQSVDLSATTTGEQGAVNFEWSNGMTGSDISVDVNGTTTLTVTATDAEGCTSTDQVTINLPEVSADAGTDQLTCEAGQCFTIGANPVGAQNADYSWSTGQSGTIKLNGANADFGQIEVCPTETVTYTLTVSDNGCSVTDDVTITIDAAPPVLSSIPSDITINCDEELPAVATPVVTDDLDTDVQISFVESSIAGNCAGDIIVRTWTATDACGNTVVETQNITVQDTTSPEFTETPQDIVLQCQDPVPTADTPTATDNCDTDVTVTLVEENTPGNCASSYVITRTWTAEDNCGNTATIQQIVTINDFYPPTFSPVADITVECDNVPAPVNPTATDNCDTELEISFDEFRLNGTCDNRYTLRRTWTAVDDCGNMGQTLQIVTVEDTTNPVLSDNPEDITINCDEEFPATPTITATDNCDTDVIVVVAMEDQIAGACANSYSTTITWIAEDNCGNTATVSQTITVEDNEAPVISNLPDLTVECDAVPTAQEPTVTDNCDTDILLTNSEEVLPGACTDSYEIKRTWVAIDNCNNVTSTTQTILVEDVTAPVFTTVVNDVTVNVSNIPAASTVLATDNCDNQVEVTLEEVSNPNGCLYTITRTWTAEDNCGNQAQLTQTITVESDLAASISASTDATCFGDADGNATVTASGGIAPYTYAWSNGATTATISNINADTYYATVTDANGCEKVAEVTISEPQAIDCAAEVVSIISTQGASDGSITVNVSGGAAPFTYAWSNGQNTQTSTQLSSGTYTVTITDTNGCTCNAEVTLDGPAKLGNVVWEDLDADGIQDPNEPGIQGVTVTLTGTDINGNPVSATTTTDSNGNYIFDGLEPGDYKVTFGTPTGYESTQVNQGTSEATDSDADPAMGGMTETITLSEGQNYPDLDAGFYQLAEIGNYVWEDIDLDGIQDTNEPAIEGITVSLTGTDAFGNAVTQNTTTDVNGLYEFTGLVPGDYKVTFGSPTGYEATQNDAGTDETQDSDANPANGNMTEIVTLESGDSYQDLDAGFYQLAELGNYVWEDLDLDGIQDANEPAIEGVTVTLTGTDAFGNPVSDATTTDVNGLYEFTGLVPGDYKVTFGAPTGYASTAANEGTDETQDSDANAANGNMTEVVTLGSGDSYQDLDAGFYQLAELGNYVWEDLDLDGIQDADEPAIEGVTVTLSGTDAFGNAVTDNTTTNSSGLYEFTDLVPGDYKVTFGAPTGYVSTQANTGTDETQDSDADPANGNMTEVVTLGSGDSYPDLDAGFYQSAEIGDFVWEDLDGDGIQDTNEPGIEGVTVTLTGTDALGNPVTLTETTGPNGEYTFTGLVPGDYKVTFGTPNGYTATTPDAGTNSAQDSDADPANGNMTEVITLESGDSYPDLDAGFYQTTNVGNFVWYDVDEDGIQGANETGVEGVMVKLLSAGNDGTLGTADDVVEDTQTTGPNGEYLFTNVAPGDYIIEFMPNTIPSGYEFTVEGQGTDANGSDANTTTGQTAQFTVVSGQQDDLTYDAGIIPVCEDITASASANGMLNCDNSSVQLNGTASDAAATYSWTGPNGFTSTDQNPSVNEPGTYTLTASLPNTCTATDQVTVEQDTELPTVTAIGGELTCTSNEIQLTGSSSIEGTIFTWTGPNNFTSSQQNPGVGEPGTYTLLVTAPNGCEVEATAIVTLDSDGPDATATGGTITCTETTVTLAGNSTTPDVTYAWAGPNGFASADQNPTVSATGTYTLIVTGANGCTTEVTAEVLIDNTTPNVMAEGGELSCTNTTVTLAGTSTTPDVSYAWVGPNGYNSADQNPTVDAAGTYTLTVTATNGCEASADVVVTEDIVNPDASAVGGTLTCEATAVTLAGSSTTTGVSYAWVGPNGFSSADQNPTVGAAGTYVLTVTAANGCEASAEAVVDQDANTPDAIATGGILTCDATSIALAGSSTTAGVSYAWVGPNGFSSADQNPTVDVAGTYTLTVTAANGCEVTAEAVVDEDIATPDASAQGGTLTCDITSIALAGSSTTAGVSYAWVGPNGFSSADQNPTVDAAGTYVLTVTAANGCEASAEAVVDEDIATPDASAQGGTLTCTETTVSLIASSATTGVSYGWVGPNGFSSADANPTVDAAGTYVLTVTAANGCEASAEAVVDEDIATPTASAQGGTLTCDATNVTLAGSSTTAGVSYAWVGPNGFSSVDQNLTVGAAGTYVLTVTAANGCEASAEAVVDQDADTPDAIATGGTLTCDVTSIALAGSSTTAGVSYAWVGPNGFSSADQNPTVDVAGTYTLTVTAPNGCEVSAEAIVELDANTPDASAQGGTLTCDITSIALAGSSTTAGVSYAWVGPNGFSSADQNPTVDAAGTYVLTVTAANGCEASAETVVNEDIATPDASAQGGTITCDVTSITLAGSSTTAGVSYAWVGPNGFSSADQNPTVGAAGTYVLTVTAANGCEASAEAVVDQDIATPDASAQGGTITCTETTVNLIASSATTGVSYAWVGPNGFSSADANPTVDAAGTYTVTVTAPNGCEATAEAVVVEDVATPNVTSIGDKLTCDATSVQITASSTTAGVSYAWVGPNGFSSADANPTVDAAGTYTVTVTAPNGCEATGEAVVDLDIDAPQITTQGGTLTCTTTEITLAGIFNSDVETFRWTGPNGYVNTDQNPTVNEPGTYTLTATATNGCQTSVDAIVDEDTTMPSINPIGGIITCAQPTVELIGNFESEVFSFNWTGPNGFTSTDQNPVVDEAGTYTLTAVAPNGCTMSMDAFVTTDLVAPNVAAIGGTITCYQPEVQLTGAFNSDVQSNVWTGPNGFTSTEQNPVVSEAGTYTLTAIAPNGCETSVETVVDEDLAEPEAHGLANGVLTCEITEVLLSGVSATPNVTFAWEGPNGFASTDQNPTVTAPGIYILTVTGQNGCSIIENVNVMEDKDTPNASAQGGVLTCDDPTIQLSASSTTADVSYAWTGPNGYTNSAQNPIVSNPGTYVLTVTAPNGCTENAEAIVELDNDAPDATAEVSGMITCADEEVQLAGNSTATGVSYAWTGPNGFTASTAITSTSVAGIYNLTVTKANGCEASASVTVEQNIATPDASAEGGTLTCANGTIAVKALSTTTGVSYSWTGPNGFTSTDQNAIVNEPGTYVVTITAPNGCSSSAQAEVGQDTEAPVSNVSVGGVLDCNNPTVTLDASTSTAGVTYQWFGPNGFTSTDATPVVTEEGTYVLTITNPANGCTAASEVTVVRETCASLGNFVWEDQNGNGIQDPNEPGIGNVTVTLTGTDEDGNAVNLNTTTNPDGSYSFDDLNPGDYTITVATPTDYIATVQNIGDDALDSDIDPTNGMSQVVTINGGDDYPDLDAGFYLPASLGDYVWEDLNGDGIQDGNEPAITGVTVVLNGTDGAGNTVSQTTTTNTDGFYEFINLAPGTYTVTFTAPTGYGATTADQGTNDANDSDADVATGESHPVTLASGDHDPTIDAGFVNSIKVGNFVWEDLNRDGIQDPNEPGIAGVVVALVGAGDDGQFGTSDDVPVEVVSTLTDGSYCFFSATPGEYQIRFILSSLPDGYIFTAQDQTTDNLDSDVDPTGATGTFIVQSGDVNNSFDAGIIASCDNVTDGGTIGVDEVGCAPFYDPTEIAELSAPTGGSGALQYIWLQSTQSGMSGPVLSDPNWQLISGATTPDYDPGAISETTYFIRCVRREGCNFFVESNIIEKHVDTDPNTCNIGVEVIMESCGDVSIVNEYEVMIEWTTSEEPENVYFVVERSTDGNTFDVVSTVPGTGYNTGTSTDYNYIDTNPVIGDVYYRVKVVYSSGSYQYCDAQLIYVPFPLRQSSGIIVYPTVTQDQTTVRLEEPLKKDAYFELVDEIGQILTTKPLPSGSVEVSFDLTGLQQATYYIYLNSNGGRELVNRVVKITP